MCLLSVSDVGIKFSWKKNLHLLLCMWLINLLLFFWDTDMNFSRLDDIGSNPKS